MRKGQHSGGLKFFSTSSTATNRITDRTRLIRAAIVDAHNCGHIQKRPQKMRTVMIGHNDSTWIATDGKYKSVVDGSIFQLQTVARGHLLKKSLHNDAVTEKQLTFMHWAWCQGEKEKSKKISSRRAAFLMPLLGTVKGMQLYFNDPYWKANPEGKLVFVVGIVGVIGESKHISAVLNKRRKILYKQWR